MNRETHPISYLITMFLALLVLYAILNHAVRGQDVISPFMTATVEASGIYYNDQKAGKDVMRCVRISRPCPTDPTKSLSLFAGNCNNDPPFSVLEIHEDPLACSDRRLMLQDSIFAHILLSMPATWHDKMDATKSYYSSDSLKQAERWTLKVKGWTAEDSTKMSVLGAIRGKAGASLRLEGEKCGFCQ